MGQCEQVLCRGVCGARLGPVIRRRKRKPYHRPGVRSRAARPIDPARAARLAVLAEAHLAARAPESAAEVRKGALVLDANAEGARLELARALYHAGDFAAALAWLGPPSDRAGAELLRGRILADGRDYPAALGAFSRALQAKPDLYEARLQRASVRLASGDPAGALPDLDTALQERPESAWARTLRASARLEAGRAAAALDDLQAVAPERRSAYHVLLQARADLLAGRPEQEVDCVFTVGLQRHRTDARLMIAFARHLAARRGQDPEAGQLARSQLERLLTDSATGLPRALEAEALFLLAELVAESPEDLERAESLFHRGLGRAPDDPAGLCGLGALLLRQGRPAHALPWLLRSIMVDPERPGTLESLARALSAIDDDDAVARWLGLLVSGLPHESPRLLARLMRFVQEGGRADAYDDVRRQAHRMKNRVAVLASRARLGQIEQLDQTADGMPNRLDELFEEWARFLQTIRHRPPAPRLLSPAHLVRRAIEQAVAEPDRLRCTLPAGLPLVRGDEDQLVDALANILTNALQAGPEDRPVRLSLRTRDADRWVEVVVTDEGPGISAEDRSRIFETGFTKKPDGSGVGLAVARRAVLSHGGHISVASAPGGPTTFTARLPAAGAQAPPSMHPYETLELAQAAAAEQQPTS